MTELVRIGVLRLADSAPVLVARERGLFAAAGLNVAVSIEPSWANIADKLTYRLLDAAVMLPPLVLATVSGMRGPRVDLAVPMGISLGGNTVTLCHPAAEVVGAPCTVDARAAARRLCAWMRAQAEPPAFAVVHQFSTHNLLLRAWLAEAGADPERDWKTVIVPPEHVVAALADGHIAGFCAGAPWGDEAEVQKAGRILLGSSQIRPGHAEKCLAARMAWATDHPQAMRRLVQALVQAQALCSAPDAAEPISALLASACGLALPLIATRAAFAADHAEKLRFDPGMQPQTQHARWFGDQLERWGWWPAGSDRGKIIDAVYGPDG